MHRFARRSALLLVLALPLAACEGVTGPSAGGETVVVLRQSAPASAALAPSYSAALAGAVSAAVAGPVRVGDIASIDITVTGVQARPLGAPEEEIELEDGEAEEEVEEGEDEEEEGDEAEEEDEGKGGWVSLDVIAPATIDLLALPSAAESGLQLARGELAPGTYGNLRIRYSEATVTFAKDVTVGGGPRAVTYVAGQAYPLKIGGGGTIRIPTGGFTVAADAGETVVITFDGSASVRTVVANPNGVRMSPVLTAAGGGEGERGGKGKGKG